LFLYLFVFHDFRAEKRSPKVKNKQTNHPNGKKCGMRNYNSVTADCKTGHNIKTAFLEKTFTKQYHQPQPDSFISFMQDRQSDQTI